jgi:hypothetical protein
MSEEQRGSDAPAPGAPGEAELASLTSTEMMLQAAVLLLNIGGRRLGLAPPSASAEQRAAAGAERDLEQVRDAIDAVRALLAVLERSLSDELRPLRDALSQLQIAYAREVQSAAARAGAAEDAAAGGGQRADGAPGEGGAAKPGETPSDEDQRPRGPGPAEASGRLWVPGR